MAEGGGTGMHLLYFANSTDVTSYESRDKQLEYTTLFPLLKKLLPPDLAEWYANMSRLSFTTFCDMVGQFSRVSYINFWIFAGGRHQAVQRQVESKM